MASTRNRYAQMRQNMSFVLIGDFAIFVMYLIAAGNGLVWLQVLSAIIALLASVLCIGYLYLTQEIFRKRSLWMTLAAGAIAVCILYSLVLNFPAPAPTPEDIIILY